jgi:hypothetical protein
MVNLTLEPPPREPRKIVDFLWSLLQSKRVLATLATLLVSAMAQWGMDQELATWLVVTLAAYVTGESVFPSLNGPMSLRFLAVIAAAISSLVVHWFGVVIDPQVLVALGTALISIILGDSVRQIVRKPKGGRQKHVRHL